MLAPRLLGRGRRRRWCFTVRQFEGRLCRRANRAIARRVDATFGAGKAAEHQARGNKLPGINVRRYLGPV